MDFREFLDRYGPTLALALTLALIIAVLPGNKDTTLTTGGTNKADQVADGAN
ncbi:MAG: hypothetical protein H0W70_08200, partial [Actinobacteria bacterium]|nr:hypothetical protein [Actinomycetota bacterium]